MADKSVADILDEAAEWLSEPGRWMQGTGLGYYWDAGKTCACMVGAVAIKAGVSPDVIESSHGEYRPLLDAVLPDDVWPVEFNDSMGRTQEEVVAKLKEAAAKARTGAVMSAPHEINQPISGIEIDTIPDVQGSYSVGRMGVTRIEACTKPGLHCDIPYVRVWKGEVCAAEFCQHNIVGVYYAPEASA